MKIVLIGAGNVGHHLGKKLHEVGEEVTQVFSRKRQKASDLAKLIKAQPISDLNKINTETDLIILAINDDAIKEVAEKLRPLGLAEKLVVHTSGATPSTVFKKYLPRYGVFYPLQTFSINKEPEFEKIPFCIHANNERDKNLLKELTLKITPYVHEINDEQRAMLHVAAVFVNNFPNHLFYVAQEILKTKNMELDILKPLIQETVNKIMENDPAQMQTGPAIRGDEKTINAHLKLLGNNSDFKRIYKLLTNSIRSKP